MNASPRLANALLSLRLVDASSPAIAADPDEQGAARRRRARVAHDRRRQFRGGTAKGFADHIRLEDQAERPVRQDHQRGVEQ